MHAPGIGDGYAALAVAACRTVPFSHRLHDGTWSAIRPLAGRVRQRHCRGQDRCERRDLPGLTGRRVGGPAVRSSLAPHPSFPFPCCPASNQDDLMPASKTPAYAVPLDIGTAEARMRRALGLQGASSGHSTPQRSDRPRSRHRFVQDGEVPVVILNSPRAPDAGPDAQAAIHAALEDERAARIKADQALAEAQATIRSLQAKLAHAELAHAEALAAERRSREHAETALRDAGAKRKRTAGHSEVEAAAQVTEPARPVAFKKARNQSARAAKAKPGAPAAMAPGPQPVKWWLPSYKAARARQR